MQTSDASPALTRLFSELIDGTDVKAAGGFALNGGDVGLLRSLDKLSAADASRAANGGATIAAHAQHLRYGLSLMNRWAAEGGNPFADATGTKPGKRLPSTMANGRRFGMDYVTKPTDGCRRSVRRGP